MAACGYHFTAAVTESGDVYTWGKGGDAQLGLGAHDDQLLPTRVIGLSADSDARTRMVMVAVGYFHAAAVDQGGQLWSLGAGALSSAGAPAHGHGDLAPRLQPTRLGTQTFAGMPVVMLACGWSHTVVLTTGFDGGVWTFGYNHHGQLGHGDRVDRLTPHRLDAQHFGRNPIRFVASGARHSVALSAEGNIWTWGNGKSGCLGNGDEQTRLIPTVLERELLAGSKVVFAAAGSAHTVGVTRDGVLWVWGCGEDGQLGLGGSAKALVPCRVDAVPSVSMAACGSVHTLAVTMQGDLWAWGAGMGGRLGCGDEVNYRIPTRIDEKHFDKAPIVCAAGGYAHSCAVTHDGKLYTWGKGEAYPVSGVPAGLGHSDMLDKLFPTLVTAHLTHGARIRRCHGLPPDHALAFCMGTHARLGSGVVDADSSVTIEGADCRARKGCAYAMMLGDLVKELVLAAASWPSGQAGRAAGRMEGLERLLGGGAM